MLASVTHELKQPINAISFSADTLLHNPHSDEQYSHLYRIKASGDLLLSLVSDIIDIAQIDTKSFKLEYQRFRLSSLLNDVSFLFETQARMKGIKYSHTINVVDHNSTDIILSSDP